MKITSAAILSVVLQQDSVHSKRKRGPVIPVENAICDLCTCLNGTATGLTNDDGSDVGMVIQCAMKALSFTTLEHTIFPEKIHSLDFRFQGLSSRQSADMFVRLWGKKLDELHIGRNRIRSLKEGMFKGVESVGFLEISAGGLRSIPDRAFRTLENLESLWLDMNGISFLSQGIFCGLDRLKNLNLNANRIRYIMPGVFQNMPNLEQLYLDQNRIRHLPGNMFYGLSKLKQLTLADNQIRNIDQGALNGLVHIDHIDLQRVDTRGWTLPGSYQASYSQKCEDWQLEFGCKTMDQFVNNATWLFNQTGVQVPSDICLSVDQIFSFTPQLCTNSTELLMCCDGVGHLREIFGLTAAYWNDKCCGTQAYSSKVLTCCGGMLYPHRKEQVCCENELKTIDPLKETCCEDKMILYGQHKCCNDQIYNSTSYCPIKYTNYLKPYFDWYPKRFIGEVPTFRTARTKKG